MKRHKSHTEKSAHFFVVCLRSAILLGSITVLAGCAQLGLGGSQAPQDVVSGAKALSKEDETKAVALFDAAIKKDPSNPALYVFIMQACMQAGRADLTKQYFQKGDQVTKGSKSDERARFLANASGPLSMVGASEEAFRAAEEAFRLMPDDPLTANQLGYFLAEYNKDPEKAVELTAKAVRLGRAQHMSDEDLGKTAVDSLGWAYYKNHQLNEAIRTLNRATQMAPGEPELHYHLGTAYHDKGKDEDAKIELLRAKSCIPQSAEMDPARAKLKKAIDQRLEEVQRSLDSRKDTAPSNPASGQTSNQ